MKVVHRILMVAVAWWLRQGGAPTVAEGCQHACGGVSIPYPFGLNSSHCALNDEFLLNCSTIEGRGEQLLLGNITVRKISPEDSTMVVRLPEIRECYGTNVGLANTSNDLLIDLSPTPQYRLSDTLNNLTVLGCDTYALISDKDGMFRSGCISYCSSNVTFTKENTCTGLGCCQAAIPKGLQKLRIKIDSIDGHVSVAGFNPCGLAFVVDRRSFNISSRTLPGINEDEQKTADVVLDWMVGSNLTCDQAKNKSSYACGNHTYCSDFENGSGYRCFCEDGYDGNPYNLTQGCQDINECENPQKYKCHGKCHNLPGSYTCEDGLGDGNSGSRHDKEGDSGIILAGILGSASTIGVCASASSTWKWRIRRINFRRHGGEHLKSAGVTIFKEAELAKATDNYDESNKLGEGSFGSLYRGKIKGDAADVVVKKPKNAHKRLVKRDFKHELKTVIQVDNKYVVKLQGICLETRVPLLVYEYILNSITLFDEIHSNVSTSLRAWKTRLKIAVEAALALKSIHSSAIIHGNIKSANILLDQNWSVKVSDFGTSVLISPEHSHITAVGIGGTLGYIDPEYLNTGKLTMKSDVYSFGAVLVELLTGKKPTSYVTTSGEPVNSVTESGESMSPISKSGESVGSITESGEPTGPVTKSEEEINIISYFVTSKKDKTLDKILPGVIDFMTSSDDEMNEVKKVAEIAVKCLHQSSSKRPAMEKVVQDFDAIDPSLTKEENKEKTKSEVTAQAKIPMDHEAVSSCLSSLGMGSACPCV